MRVDRASWPNKSWIVESDTIKTEERSHTVSIAISSAQVVLQGLVLVCLTSSVEMQLETNLIGGSTIYKTRNPVNWTSYSKFENNGDI